jgi:hypothetical protein
VPKNVGWHGSALQAQVESRFRASAY